MKLDHKAFGIACGLVWALTTALIYLGNRFIGCAGPWVNLLNSIYYGARATIKGSAIATIWALVDGFLGGFILAYIYNLFSSET
ncbi:MAG: bacteriophage holin [Candidatus Margulisbacteria bacterium]|nr:bacteriophage holin [Candidatus Margulisiibacteriota bacterium]